MPPKEKFNVIHCLARKERVTSSCHARPGPQEEESVSVRRHKGTREGKKT